TLLPHPTLFRSWRNVSAFRRCSDGRPRKLLSLLPDTRYAGRGHDLARLHARTPRPKMVEQLGLNLAGPQHRSIWKKDSPTSTDCTGYVEVGPLPAARSPRCEVDGSESSPRTH